MTKKSILNHLENIVNLSCSGPDGSCCCIHESLDTLLKELINQEEIKYDPDTKYQLQSPSS